VGFAVSEFKVLIVCTGNICRSPTAEGVLRHKLRDAGLDGRVAVDSAGTIDFHAGDPPDPRAILQAGRRGYDLSDLRARQIRPGDFESFDLILCMDRGHMDRGHYGELARLCPVGLRERLRLFLDFAPGLGLEEVPDPYYGGLEDYDLALDLIEPGVAGLIEVIERDFL
jgi:protein-tyrosine phosphatase